MKRKVFAGSAVAAALLFQLTAVGFPAYAAEYDAVQKEEFVSSFSDAETKQVAQYLVDNGLSLEESKDLMKTYEKGLAIIAISALRGKNVKLVFVVKDSGDNTYDTAAVVDNVTLTK